MRWIYKVQQHMAITAGECWALLGLLGLLGLGLGVQAYQGQQAPVDPAAYAVVQAAVHAAVHDTLAADTTAVARDTLPRPGTPMPVAQDTVPRKKRKAKGVPARMNLNTATPGQLVRLPGIGPRLAERVIAYRTQHGPFRTPGDLIRVKGIGQKKLEKLLPYVFVADSLNGG